ncbi:MFS transporter [Novosphingobium ovatum]|uniref:MFS transporter n=1 Tax=Novosphingobium ovatum TaxID=1908523 RepID=UPI0029FF386B|nr:MFS transporter [Novosphingobium ovatum]
MVHADAMSPRQKSLALLTLIVAQVLEIVDMTIVNTALPAIKAEIGAGSGAAQWIVAGYSLAFALLLMAGGRLGDSFGYRRMFLIGVAGFSLSSLACGMAQDGTQLVAARLAQGATGAIMGPQVMALIQVMFEPLQRVSKMALFGIIGGLAAIAGPVLGGLLIKADLFDLGWRIVFLINLPVGVLALVAGWRYLPRAKSARPGGYDLAGMGWFAAALALVMAPFAHAEGQAISLTAYGLALASVPLGWIGWRHVSARVAQGRVALFDPALFAIPTFRLGLLSSVVFAAANGGFLLIFAFALQAERGQTPLMTGLLHMPFGLGAMVGIGVLGRHFLPKLGRWVLVIGGGVMALSCVLVFGGIGPWMLSWTALVPVLVLAGIGMGLATGSLGPITVAQVDRDHAGAASSLLKTAQQLGAAVGVAVCGSAYFGGVVIPGLRPLLLAAAIIAGLELVCVAVSLRLPGDIFGRRPAHAAG